MLKLYNRIIICISLFHLVKSTENPPIDANNRKIESEEFDKFQKLYNSSVFEGISQKLKRDIRIFCVILASPKFEFNKCIPQKMT
uniref:Uncharacterized protein n=1 Tax=Strongyloides papillosus TaxID=174720 RepID=A0A0N5C024_STREA